MNVPEPAVAEPEEPASAEPAAPAADPTVELPSPQAVVRELEEFLKQLRERDGGPSEPSSG
jgi:hypothetical protein